MRTLPEVSAQVTESRINRLVKHIPKCSFISLHNVKACDDLQTTREQDYTVADQAHRIFNAHRRQHKRVHAASVSLQHANVESYKRAVQMDHSDLDDLTANVLQPSASQLRDFVIADNVRLRTHCTDVSLAQIQVYQNDRTGEQSLLELPEGVPGQVIVQVNVDNQRLHQEAFFDPIYMGITLEVHDLEAGTTPETLIPELPSGSSSRTYVLPTGPNVIFTTRPRDVHGSASLPSFCRSMTRRVQRYQRHLKALGN